MSVSSVDRVSWSSLVILIGVLVQQVRLGRLVASGRPVLVTWEKLGEGVSHFDLAIESTVHSGQSIKTSILTSSFGCWGFFVVCISVWQACLEFVCRVNISDWGMLSQTSSVVVECA